MTVNDLYSRIIVIRGGGDIASGTIHRFHRCGFKLLVLEVERPTLIRRTVSFAQVMYDGSIEIEGVTARKAETLKDAYQIIEEGDIPVMADPEGNIIEEVQPVAVIDGILAKVNLGTRRGMAPIVIGLGPGFEGGKDVDAVIETNRGHFLGKVIFQGLPEPNTGTPGIIAGHAADRVIRAEGTGKIEPLVAIGEMVKVGDPVAKVNDIVIKAPLTGVVRGIINPGLDVTPGYKIGDVDPRAKRENCFTISDKARAVAGGALEALLELAGKK